MDIRKLIKERHVYAEKYQSPPNPDRDFISPGVGSKVGKRLFGISINEPVDDGYLAYVLIFDLSWSWGVCYKTPTECKTPWSLKNRIPTSKMVEVDQKTIDDIKNDESLKKVVVWFLGNNEQYVKIAMDKLQKLSFDKNNAYVRREREKEIAKKRHDEVVKYAEEKGAGMKFSYYCEYYRGENAFAHDDDYEGSGDISLGGIVTIMKIESEEEVDKLIERFKTEGQIVYIAPREIGYIGSYRYFFRMSN